MNCRGFALFLVVGLCCLGFSVDAYAWRSILYDMDWSPPHTQDSAPDFETQKLIQDFSYAGYRRSEVELPQVSGPVFDVVEDFGADATGSSDTTGAIQDAIDVAAEAGGGVVYLPAGTYRVSPSGDASASLRIRSSNIVLRGDGPSQTYLLNDEWQMRGTDIIRVDSPNAGWASVPDGSPETDIASDLLEPTVEIPVENAQGFSPGDWVVLRADATDPFTAEHNMEDLWADQSLGAGVLFIRQVLTVDDSTNILTIDVPTRYYLKTRDNARVHLVNPHLEEVGLEDFSIGNIEHPNHGSSSGWGVNEYHDEGSNAYDVHASYALRLQRVRNSWVRNVHTYRPEQNESEAHVLSNGLRIGNSVAVTVKDSHFQRALYAGGGGNAYMVRITNAQEILMQDTVVGYNRHGFVFSHMQTSGNVIHRGRAEHTGWRAVPGGAGSSGSDHHMWLSQSNLVDNTQLLRDYFVAFYRHTWGSNHGHSAVHSVFWNLEGLEYYSNRDHIVNTQQARYGYAIGTRGEATGISTAGTPSFAGEAHRTEPEDHVEGEGEGATLEPRSLFADQLYRRMTSPQPDGRASTPEVSPPGGSFGESQQVQISSESADATIYYTLNGATPTTDSAIYDAPIELDEDTNLRAVAVADGLADSPVTAAAFRFSGDDCRTIADTWWSTPSSRQIGPFEFEFEATPSVQPINSVMGLSDGDAHRYQDLAAIARFSPEGIIDARNGGDYEADTSIYYEASTTYRFRFVVDIGAGTYDVYVTPEGEEQEVLIASDYDFRTEQAKVYRLNRFASFAAEGENLICDLVMPADLVANESEQEGDDGDDGGDDDNGSDGDDTDTENGGQDDGHNHDTGDDPDDDTDDHGDDGSDSTGDPIDETPEGEETQQSDDPTTASSQSSCSSTAISPANALFLVGLFGLWLLGIRRNRDALAKGDDR